MREHEQVAAWLARDPDPETREELQALLERGEEEEIGRRFAGRLAFGTAGLRGLMGAGPTRMNRLVVRETTAGLGHYLLATLQDSAARGVVVGYDARRGSRDFAQDAAATLAGMGIVVHLFASEVPTPLCAFAVGRLGAAGGVMVTASHNPPAYNGYKVYWHNGAQIIPPHDVGIATAIEQTILDELPWMDLEAARKRGLVRQLGEELAEIYLVGVEGLRLHRPASSGAKLCIAYTPLHGVGGQLANEALKRAGFSRVYSVPSQSEPDSAFPTVAFPNPEEPEAMDALLALANEVQADLAFAHDPDADRLAVAVRNAKGRHVRLSGNEVGVLLGWDRMRTATPGSVVGSTIVSSRLLEKIARVLGMVYFETLTGFKWMANEGLAQTAQGRRFLFAYEEALGYQIGTLVCDKDGISALVSFAELARASAEQGSSVLGSLEALYREHGLHVTAQRSLPLASGSERVDVGARLREALPTRVASRAVVHVADYLEGWRRYADGREEALALPPSDVLIFALQGDARVVVRPSGTEPKLKCYYELSCPLGRDEPMDEGKRHAEAELERLMEAHQEELGAFG